LVVDKVCGAATVRKAPPESCLLLRTVTECCVKSAAQTETIMLDLYVYTCGELRRDADRHHKRVV